MTTDATLILHELACHAESDGTGHSEPYLWPVLLRIDDNTLATPQLVEATAPLASNARVVLRQNMRAGQSAAVPASVGVLRTRYAENQARRKAVFVVALWENDETPQKAVTAGFRAYVAEVRAAIAANLLALDGAEGEELDGLIDQIERRIESKVRSAISGALTAAQKIRVGLGTLNLDDIVGSAFHLVDELDSVTFNLPIERGSSERYELRGELQVRRTPIDLCQAQRRRVQDAQSALASVQAAIADLQAQLNGQSEPTMPKAALIAEIKRLRAEELAPAAAALDVAQEALRRCRERPVRHIDPVIVATHR